MIITPRYAGETIERGLHGFSGCSRIFCFIRVDPSNPSNPRSIIYQTPSIIVMIGGIRELGDRDDAFALYFLRRVPFGPGITDHAE
jgi:hypothetical protein